MVHMSCMSSPFWGGTPTESPRTKILAIWLQIYWQWKVAVLLKTNDWISEFHLYCANKNLPNTKQYIPQMTKYNTRLYYLLHVLPGLTKKQSTLTVKTLQQEPKQRTYTILFVYNTKLIMNLWQVMYDNTVTSILLVGDGQHERFRRMTISSTLSTYTRNCGIMRLCARMIFALN